MFGLRLCVFSCHFSIYLLALHTIICVTFSLPPSVRGWLRFLLVALHGLFCLLFFKSVARDVSLTFFGC